MRFWPRRRRGLRGLGGKWYRVHSQKNGWLGWAHDGEDAGTTGLYRRMEDVEVRILPKGQVPGGYDATAKACVRK